ncbi:flagellar biosynthesis regulator FlaF [Pseudooceanicola sp. HF7]|nr:flagellar biosynthesis regulator FlaF [Pseudooceanicola sp. HF7]NIZ09738.1 flagellar biosynthesis regulator FlaF [Pseudooceanicola sp. HF7]
MRAYGQASTPVRTPRGTEYEVFARVTRGLITAAKKDQKTGFPELARAIYENRRLWILLAADVAGDDNALPQELRAQIFYLAEFTQVHSQKVLTGKAGVRALVEVNSAIMRGLRSEGVRSDPARSEGEKT